MGIYIRSSRPSILPEYFRLLGLAMRYNFDEHHVAGNGHAKPRTKSQSVVPR